MLGLGFEPLSAGIARPPPHPVAARRNSRTKPEKYGLRILRIERSPSGARMPAHNKWNRIARGCRGRAALETPVSTVTETVVAVPRDTLEGVILHVELAGAPEHVNVTVPGTFAAEVSSKG